MEHRAPVDRIRQVHGPAAIRCQRQPDAADYALVVEAGFVRQFERMALAGDQHVGIAIEPELDGPAGFPGAERRDAGDQRRLRLLAAEAATQAPALHHDVLGVEAEAMRHQALHLARMLGRTQDQQGAVLAGQRDADLALEIKMFLSAEGQRTAQPAGRGADAKRRIAAGERPGRQYEGLAFERGSRVADRFELLVLDLRQPHGPARRAHRGRDHREQRLARVLDDIHGEDRVVMHHGSVIVLARDVRGGQYRDDARCRADRVQIHPADAGMSAFGGADCGMQRALGQRNVVGIERPARDVQARALMRLRRADAAADARPVA
jgi:hypothetical protein